MEDGRTVPSSPGEPPSPNRSPGDRSRSPALFQARDVLIMVPTLNEEHRIESCLLSLLDGLDETSARLVVIDGGSTDRTVEIVTAMSQAHPALSLLHNPRRLQAPGINLAARTVEPDRPILLRADAHAMYPPDFVRICVEALLSTGAASVVVPMQTTGIGRFQRAVAAAQNSLIGTGGAAHRSVGVSRLVDHGHHAAFRRSVFLDLGGYDESFSHNEDAEFDRRLRARGNSIWLCCEARITYYPRQSLGSLARQYRAYGRGRCRTVLKHHERLKLRQMMPLVITAAWIVSLVGSLFAAPMILIAVALVGIYLAWSVVSAIRVRDAALLGLGLAAAAMHVSWAVGFVEQTWRNRSLPRP